MNQARRMLGYFLRFLKDRKFRNRVLNMMSQTAETSKKSGVLSQNAFLEKSLKDKRLFFIGGCELSFLKEYLESNIRFKTLHTFDYGASSNPLFEVQDNQSEIWSFGPDIVILSHNQQIRSYFQALQLQGVTAEDQDEQLKEVQASLSETMHILREKGITGPIIILTYPLAYRPALGRFEYQSIKTSYSLVEFTNILRLTYYEIAKNFSDVFILDVDEVFARVGKDKYIRRLDANGIYEHVTRAGSTILGDELLTMLGIYYNVGRKIKCAVFDLDNTLWDGIIQDDGIEGVSLDSNRIAVLRMLQKRGIVLTIASKNEPATEPLIDDLLGANADLFTLKKINWNDKFQSLQEIANELNIGIDSLAFFDDSPFEREQVKTLLPHVAVYPETAILDALQLPEFDTGVLTAESIKRGRMYQQQKKRGKHEKTYLGSKDEFLKKIQLKMWIREAAKGDLDRVAELIQRANQLNATTIRFMKSEIVKFHKSDKHRIFVANLLDKYGEYGLIGVAITEENKVHEWKLISFLFSCRAMGKTVEYNTLAFIQREAKKKRIRRLVGQYRKTDRNTAIRKVFKEAKFQEESSSGEFEAWFFDLENQSPLDYYKGVELIERAV